MTGFLLVMTVFGVAATADHWPHIMDGFRWLGRGLADLAEATYDLLWPFRR